MSDTKADLVVRRLDDGQEVHRVHLSSLGEMHVQRVMMGMLRNMGDNYYIDDSEVEATRKGTPHEPA